ncbi:ORF185 [White spot syndrome virus]|uniref:ORF185 n=2 Tax=White spot syndrome virus TaxID=342409 RepID=A0A2D3I5P0_9VIRU|nr:ORF185 [White spot syndrome virus]
MPGAMGVRAGSWKTPPPFHALPHYCTIFWCIKRHGEVAKTSTRRDITVKMTSPTSALRVATTALLFAVVVTATVISEAGGTKIDDRCAFRT